MTGKTQHLGAVATLSEVECHGSLGVGSVRGSDGESESGSKGTANVDGVVRAGNGEKTCGTDRSLVDRFAVFNVDVDDAVALEKLEDLLAGVVGILALERIRTDAYPHHNRTPDLLVFVSVGDETNDVDGL